MWILDVDTNVMKADFAAHYKPYAPDKIMAEFNAKFLDGRLVRRQDPLAAAVGQSQVIKLADLDLLRADRLVHVLNLHVHTTLSNKHNNQQTRL